MQIKIGAVKYRLREVDEIVDAVGEYDPIKCEIRILKNLKQDMRQLSLIHELIHAINNELTEFQTEALAQGIHSLIKDNPKLFSMRY